MAYFLSVANRKGGVGKSTTAVMLAHAFAAWGGKRVLVMDLDSQCNASLILMGGEAWSRARLNGLTISDYFFDLFDETHPESRDFLVHDVGDVRHASGKPLALSLLPGSLMLEDVQGELYVKEARQSKDPDVVGQRVRGRLERLLRRFEQSYDIVIIDCPPGLSFAAVRFENRRPGHRTLPAGLRFSDGCRSHCAAHRGEAVRGRSVGNTHRQASLCLPRQ